MFQSDLSLGNKTVDIQTVADPVLDRCQISLRVVRLDQLHPELSGNKWFKLLPNLKAAKAANAHTLLSFGGAFSNHIHALAAAGPRFGFRTIGIIRGELVRPLNSTLAFADQQGMQLVPVSRAEYRLRHDPAWLQSLMDRFGEGVYVVPEGGANLAGVQGCADIAAVLADQVADLQACEVLLPCGTGTTLAGLVHGLSNLQQHVDSDARAITVRGFAVLKGADFLRDDIAAWLKRLATSRPVPWELETAYHQGGYARCPPNLAAFIQQFERQHNIPLEPVYSGKLMAAIYQKTLAGEWRPGTRLLMLHTGGLQARQ